MTQNSNIQQSYFVSGVCCAAEEGIVRQHLDGLIGREGYTFNSLTHELCLRDASQAKGVLRQLDRAGFPARGKEELERPQSFWERHRDGATAAGATLLAVVGMVGEKIGAADVIVHGLLLGAIVVGGWRVFVRAWKSLLTYAFDMNVLMSIAVVGALMIDKWSEGAAVIILFSISLMLEGYSNRRTRRAIQALMTHSPETACVVEHGRELVIAANEVVPGQIVLVRPGERIPIDGVIVSGSSFLDQAVVTGEATPIEKETGDQVFAGSINGRGALHVQATSLYEDTTLARMVHLVEEAQRTRAPVQTLVERFARLYTPVVLALAVVVAVLPPIIMHATFGEWFHRALSLLVIACPCALLISTPVTLVSTLARAAQLGILIKGGRQIETLNKVKAIAFDKTGTLTRGRPTVTDIVSLNSLPREGLLRIVAALEHRSEHPLASAITAEVARHSVEYNGLAVDSFEALPGLGVRATIDGKTFFLGNHQLCEAQGFCSPIVEEILTRFEQEGKTVVILGSGGKPLGIVAVQDSAREHGARSVTDLRTLGVNHMMLLSGDREESARRLAAEVGIEEYRGDLLPQEKIKLVEQLKSRYGSVVMVGDGINDAPAMAAASVGIAMGVSGTDVALETADVVLMGDDLSKLPLLVRLSRNAMTIIKQNITIALSLKLVFMCLSVVGATTLWMAVLADDGAALIVIFNGLRMLSTKGDS